MEAFTITEDFPKSEVEFDQRFSDPKACYAYLFAQKWPEGFICSKCCYGPMRIHTAFLAFHRALRANWLGAICDVSCSGCIQM